MCKLRKTIYGSKESPHVWFDKFSITVLQHGFKSISSDHSLFVCNWEIYIIYIFWIMGKRCYLSSYLFGCYLVIYLDDVIIIGNDHNGIVDLTRYHCSSF